MNKSQDKMMMRTLERHERSNARLGQAECVLEVLAEWLENDSMPHPGTLMPDGKTTIKQAVTAFFQLPK